MKKANDSKRKFVFDIAEGLKAIDVAVVWPESKEALLGAAQAFEKGIINPILIGNSSKIKKIAAQHGQNISHFQCIESTLEDSTKKAIQLVHEKKAQAIMKGSLQTHILLHDILHHGSGLTTEKLASHCMLVDTPCYKKALIISDCVLNVTPTLIEKKNIIQNTIDFAIKIGIKDPKVALLSAVETISNKIKNTEECAILCKMAERKQIRHGILDGPLSFDVAISPEAASRKKVNSKVAGDPDILIAPNLETGNILFKSFGYIAKAKSYGMLVGTKIPIILTSRIASPEERVESSALARYYLAR